MPLTHYKGNSDSFSLSLGRGHAAGRSKPVCRFCLDAVLLRAGGRKRIPRPFAIFAVSTTLHWTVGARVFRRGYRLAPALDDHHNDRVTDLPPLLRAYLALGGKVSDHAAIDPDLGTTLLFTGVDVAQVPQKRAQRLRAILAAH